VLGLIHGIPGAVMAAAKAARTGGRVPLESELRLAERGEESPQKRGSNIPYLAYPSPDWGLFKTAADWLGVPLVARNAAELLAGGMFGRFANFQHTLFKNLGESAMAHRNAYVATAKEGLLPIRDASFEDRYRYHFLNPTDDVLRDNVNAGYSGTFMEKLGPATQRLASALKDTPLRWEFPFLHVPINIARKGISWSPMAFAGPEMRARLTGKRGPREQALALAAVVNGTALLSYFAYLATIGEATGDYPTDKAEQDRWKALNIQPNSFKSPFSNEWVSYNRFGPLRIPLNMGGNLGQIIKNYDVKKSGDEEMAKAIGTGIMATAHSISDEVGMLALHQFFEAQSGQRGLAHYAAETAASFLPYNVGLAQLAAFNDPYLRQVKSFTDAIKYKWPWARQELLPKRDALFGEPVVNPAYQTLVRMAPFAPDPIKMELDKIGYHPAAPKAEIGKVKLTPEQYDRYEATAGPYIKKSLTEVMNSPAWRMHNNDPEWQKTLAKSRIAQGRARARAAMQADSIVRDGPNNLVTLGRQRRRVQINGTEQ
jgi:hypothetical protein